MMNYTSMNYDCVIGMACNSVAVTNPKARLSATIQSLLVSELLLIYQNDNLTLEIVLDKIEMMEETGWEMTLRWLGHFYTWESYREDWHMTPGEQEIYAGKKDKTIIPLNPMSKRKKGEK